MGQFRLACFAALATAATAAALVPVVSGTSWLLPAGGGLVLVVLVGWTLRRFAWPAGVVLLLQLGAVAEGLTLWFARDTLAGGVLPTQASLDAYQQLLTVGYRGLAEHVPPVAGSAGLDAVLATVVCLVTLLVDAIAVTLRRSALAGMPLLALFSVPAFLLPHGVEWWRFAVVAAGYVALLLADGRERLGRWGRPLTASENSGDSTGEREIFDAENAPVTRTGRRIGLLALAAALSLPLLVPGMKHNSLRDRMPNRDTITQVQPMANLKDRLVQRSGVEVLRIRTDSTRPSDQYLRLAALDVFDGEQWRFDRTATVAVPDPLPSPPGLSPAVPARNVHTEVTVKSLSSKLLPTPYPLVRIEDEEDDLTLDPEGRFLFSLADVVGRTYQVESLDLEPSDQQLRSAAPVSRHDPRLARYLELPSNLPAVVKRTAKDRTARAGTSIDQARKLQAWFTGGAFTYDTSPPQDVSNDAMENFLTTRRGFCVQFAGTFAAMARFLGIPARVVIGFTAGDRVGVGEYRVSGRDTHMWPELYFSGVGWLRFEPTPGDAGNASAAGWSQTNTGNPRQPGQSVPSLAPSATPTGCAGTGCAGATRPGSGTTAPTTDWVSGWRLALWLVPAVLLLLLPPTPTLLRVVRSRLRRRRSHGQSARKRNRLAWLELRDAVRDLGFGWDPAETPRQFLARLVASGRLTGRARTALERLVAVGERVRYSPEPGAVGDLLEDVAQVRKGLYRSLPAGRRIRFVLLPRSVAESLGRQAGGGLSRARPRRERRAPSRR